MTTARYRSKFKSRKHVPVSHKSHKSYKSRKGHSTRSRLGFRTSIGLRAFEEKQEKQTRAWRALQAKKEQDALFRSPSMLWAMTSTKPSLLGGKSVRYFLVNCHGGIRRKEIVRVPHNMAAFDLAENECRGARIDSSIIPTYLNVMIGKNGINLPFFMQAMVGGRGPRDDPGNMVSHIAYRSPGDIMYDVDLGFSEEEDSTLGCWELTNNIEFDMNFDPSDFKDFDPAGHHTMQSRHQYLHTKYNSIDEINELLTSESGTYMSTIFSELKKICKSDIFFVFLISCVSLMAENKMKRDELPSQPAAMSHYAMDYTAKGVPSGIKSSMKGRDKGKYRHPNTM